MSFLKRKAAPAAQLSIEDLASIARQVMSRVQKQIEPPAELQEEVHECSNQRYLTLAWSDESSVVRFRLVAWIPLIAEKVKFVDFIFEDTLDASNGATWYAGYPQSGRNKHSVCATVNEGYSRQTAHLTLDPDLVPDSIPLLRCNVTLTHDIVRKVRQHISELA